MNRQFLILCVYLVFIHLGSCYPGRRIACSPLTLKNGKVKTRPRTFAQFVCNKGYILAGERFSKCSQGKWDTPPPICVRPNCQKVQQLKNGVIHLSHRGGVLNFYCAANYALEGPRYAYCVDMKWNTHMPSCLPTNAKSSMNCDFETADICGWTHDLNHNFDWTRLSNKTPSGHLATGPSDDHTKGPGGNGYYMYIEASTKNVNDTARLISPMYRKLSNNTCLEFYYHMYGSGIGQLRVYVKKINDSWILKPEDAVFWKQGNHGNMWLKAFIELGPINDQFQVIFEGVRGISYISDIAIDDVKIIENCIIDYTTTTEQEMYQSTFSYDSCTNRCNTSSTPEMSCSCDVDCFDNSTCCPDYIVVCLLSNDSDTTDYTTEEDTETTTETNEVITTTVSTAQPMLPTLSSFAPRLPLLPPKPTLPTSTNPVVNSTSTVAFKSNITFVKPPIYINKTAIIPTKKPIIIQPNPVVTFKPVIVTKPIKMTTALVLPTTSKQTTSFTTERLTKATVTKYFLNDMLTIPDVTTEDDYVIKEELIPKEYYPDEHGLLSEKTAPVHEKPRPTNKTSVIAVLTVCFIVIGILGVTFLVKRYTGRNCMRVRRIRSGNGDSQSDVRFLTNDEILDFTLATPSDRN